MNTLKADDIAKIIFEQSCSNVNEIWHQQCCISDRRRDGRFNGRIKAKHNKTVWISMGHMIRFVLWQPIDSYKQVLNLLENIRAGSRFVPSQWETSLLCDDVSYWLGANLESALPEFVFERPDFESWPCQKKATCFFKWASWGLKLPTTRLLVQQFV